MPWRYWLFDLPARMVDWVVIAYGMALLVTSFTTLTGVLLSLGLWLALGIRWGW